VGTAKTTKKTNNAKTVRQERTRASEKVRFRFAGMAVGAWNISSPKTNDNPEREMVPEEQRGCQCRKSIIEVGGHTLPYTLRANGASLRD
jgi:hypothetical protein